MARFCNMASFGVGDIAIPLGDRTLYLLLESLGYVEERRGVLRITWAGVAAALDWFAQPAGIALPNIRKLHVEFNERALLQE